MKVLITGGTGQDGIFLVDKILKDTNFDIYVCTRNQKYFDFNKLKYLKNNEDLRRLKLIKINYLNFEEVLDIFTNVHPNYVYNLMGPSSVKMFNSSPEEMNHIATSSFNNIINSLIKTNNFCNFYQASSSEMYGYDAKFPFDEQSKFKPNSYYAKSKYSLHLKSLDLKDKYGWNIISGIMFNHESEFRNSSFLIMKLVEKVIDINKGNSSILELPSLAINRDWTYAKEISEAITKLTFNNLNGSYVIGSGKSYSISDIADYLFRKVNLDYRDFVKENNSIMRDGEPLKIISNPLKIKNDTGWVSKLTIFEILDKMYDYRLNRV